MTGEIIGLGTRQYELVPVPAGNPVQGAFGPDPRPIGVRVREKFQKFRPFPSDRHDGHGFLREEEVDLARINALRARRR